MSNLLLCRHHPAEIGDTNDYSLYENQYLTTEALESGTITFTIPSSIGTYAVVSVSYRKNSGAWTTTANSSSGVTISVSVAANDVIEWKADATRFASGNSSGNYSYFSSTCQCNVYGNILSLLYEDAFINKYTLKTDETNTFNSIFSGWTNLIDASNLILPVTEVNVNDGQNMYACMFKDCTSLIYPPNELPEITALSALSSVYVQMFEGCTSLIKCPDMDWGVLGNCNHGTFYQMFRGCTALSQNIPNKIEVEEYSATANYTGLFRLMFENCTHITTIPSLIIHNYTGANTNVNHASFNSTFKGCTSLVDISNKTLSILNNSNCNSYYDFYYAFYGCTSLQKTPLLKIPETHKSTFTRTFENVRNITDLYLDIDTIYSTNTLADESFYYMFVNTGGTSSPSAYRGNNSTLHLLGTIDDKSDFANSHGIWGVTSSGSTGYAGWSPYWGVSNWGPAIMTIYMRNFPAEIEDIYDKYDDRAMEAFINEMCSLHYNSELCDWPYCCDEYIYVGNIIEIDGNDYYIWYQHNWSATYNISDSWGFALLTNSVDYSDLYEESLESGYNVQDPYFGKSIDYIYGQVLSDYSVYRTSNGLVSENYHIIRVVEN